MQKTKHVLIGCGLILALGGQIAPVHAQQPARGLVTTVSMSRAAQIFDMSPTGTCAGRLVHPCDGYINIVARMN